MKYYEWLCGLFGLFEKPDRKNVFSLILKKSYLDVCVNKKLIIKIDIELNKGELKTQLTET